MQVGKNLIDYHRVLDAGDHFDGAAAFTARLNIDIENPLQSLCPGHGCATFGRRLVFRLVWRLGLVAFSPLRGRHLHTMLAVGCKHAVTNSSGMDLDDRRSPAGWGTGMFPIKPGEVDS